MFDRIKEKVYEGGEMMTDAWKLRKHVIWDPRDMDKQVVDHAAKLLSNTMARTIRFFFKDEPEKATKCLYSNRYRYDHNLWLYN